MISSFPLKSSSLLPPDISSSVVAMMKSLDTHTYIYIYNISQPKKKNLKKKIFQIFKILKSCCSPDGEMDDLLETDESVEENNTNMSEENQSRCGGQWGDFCKHCIYGSLDGVLTTFAIVSAGAGGSLSRQAIFVLGVSNIAADSLNMGLGDALSAISHHEYVLERYSDQKARLSSRRNVEQISIL